MTVQDENLDIDLGENIFPSNGNPEMKKE